MTQTCSNLNDDQWLLRHASNINSLSGEDGIIESIFKTILPANRWCVEFGAWDGKTYSNTYNLMRHGSWSGVFVEADQDKFKDLTDTYRDNPRAHCINCWVNFVGENSLDALLARTPIPKDFDLLSIDIDGNDYHVWESMTLYQPRVVIIEFNQTIPSHIEFVQPRDMRVHQGNSARSLVNLGEQKGYELICVTDYNAIFVKSALFESFHIKNNSLTHLRPDKQQEYCLFQLFDGTFVVGGHKEMPWHSLPVRQDKFQILPKMFRAYPPESLSGFKQIMRRIWTYLYRRGIL